MRRIVEAYSDGGLVASYDIILGHANMPAPTDDDFINQAKEDMLEDGSSPALVDDWLVRVPGPGE